MRHILKAYEPRIAVYGAALHQQEPDVAVAVGKDGYLKVSSLKKLIPETQLTSPLLVVAQLDDFCIDHWLFVLSQPPINRETGYSNVLPAHYPGV